MCLAAAALHFCPGHAVAGIRFSFDRTPGRRGIKTRPARPRVVLGVGSKQWLSAANAGVRSRRLRGFVFAGERRFSALLSGDMILIRRELLLPILFRLRDLFWQFSLLCIFERSDSAGALDVAEKLHQCGMYQPPSPKQMPEDAGSIGERKGLGHTAVDTRSIILYSHLSYELSGTSAPSSSRPYRPRAEVCIAIR